ncbi:Nop domain-containing protein [Mycena kentingensis (nom. inval.)]|nr:Nop domain-containing protein [Mycena kentingensis (nom. inval.)]
MENSVYGSWLESQFASQPSVHRSDWPKPQSEQPAPSRQPPHHPSPLDLSAFNLESFALPATSTSSSSAPSAQPGFAFYPNHSYNQEFPQWPPPTSQSPPIPLSTYSSLNGATSAGAASQSSPPNSHHMNIDPTLTTINGASNSYPQSGYSTQTSTRPSQPQSQPQRRAMYYNQSSEYDFMQQSQSQPQGTLSPHALHTPASFSNFFTQASGSRQERQPVAVLPPPAPSSPTPQERQAAFASAIRPLLASKAFSGGSAVDSLTTRISHYGISEVDAVTRLEIVTKIRDQAGNHYFRAWSQNTTAIEITREWLKAAFTATKDGGDEALVETIMPLLHIIDRLPMTLPILTASKLGKLIVRLVKDAPTPAIKDMAANIERRWRQLVSEADTTDAVAEDAKTKKRKSSEPPSRPAPPPKKTAVGNLKPVVKKEPVASTSKAASKDAKSDASFFSAPKAKPKLPSFKKGPPPAAAGKKEDGNVAQPNATNPFEEALKSMKARKDSPMPSVSAGSPAGGNAEASTSAALPGYTKKGKRKKTVTWPVDSQLASIRVIERAIYVTNRMGRRIPAPTLRDLDRDEGAAMHQLIFDEVLDWSEPQPLEPPETERGSESQEKETQAIRETTALESHYMTAASIPDSPAEPSQVISIEEADKDAREMMTGPDVEHIFWSPQPTVTPSVAELLSGLGDSAPVVGDLAPDNIQQLLAQLASGTGASGVQQAMQTVQQTGDWTATNQFNGDFVHGMHDDGADRSASSLLKMLVLYETAMGYALFKVGDAAKLDSDDLWKEFESPEKASRLLKLKAIHRFHSTATAVEDVTALQKGKLGKGLKEFLTEEVVNKGKNKESLLVIDPHLSQSISKKLSIKVSAAEGKNDDLWRGIRSQLAALLNGVDPKDLATMSLGLSHSLSRFKLKFSPDKVDTMVVQAIALLDDLDKEINIYAMRVKECCPINGHVYREHFGMPLTILSGFRTNASSTSFAAILPEDLEAVIKAAAEISMGTEISDSDIAHIHSLCDQVISIAAYRTQLAEYLRNRMVAIAPNLTALVGELVGARLISHAGSLLSLAKHPASTVQILGAEKALFRALKTKHDTPKYGLIYHASLIGQAPPKLKGKMARMVATKAALSIRVDALTDSDGKSDASAASIGVENRAKLESRLRALEYQDDQSGVRRFADGAKKGTAKFTMSGETKTYNTSADAVEVVSTQRDGPMAVAVQAVLDVKEEKRRAKEERRAKKKAEKEKAGGDEKMDLDGDEEEESKKDKKRKRRESEAAPEVEMKTEETEEERKARKKAKKAEKAAAAAAAGESDSPKKKKKKKSEE